MVVCGHPIRECWINAHETVETTHMGIKYISSELPPYRQSYRTSSELSIFVSTTAFNKPFDSNAKNKILMTKFTLHRYLWTYIIYPSSNKWIIGHNIANDTWNWAKTAQFMLSPTQCITCRTPLRVQNKNFRVSVWILYKVKCIYGA